MSRLDWKSIGLAVLLIIVYFLLPGVPGAGKVPLPITLAVCFLVLVFAFYIAFRKKRS